jgi:hypothetical protein
MNNEKDIDRLALVLEDAFYVGRNQETTRDDSADWRRAALCAMEFWRENRKKQVYSDLEIALTKRIEDLLGERRRHLAQIDSLSTELGTMPMRLATAEGWLARLAARLLDGKAPKEGETVGEGAWRCLSERLGRVEPPKKYMRILIQFRRWLVAQRNTCYPESNGPTSLRSAIDFIITKLDEMTRLECAGKEV